MAIVAPDGQADHFAGGGQVFLHQAEIGSDRLTQVEVPFQRRHGGRIHHHHGPGGGHDHSH